MIIWRMTLKEFLAGQESTISTPVLAYDAAMSTLSEPKWDDQSVMLLFTNPGYATAFANQGPNATSSKDQVLLEMQNDGTWAPVGCYIDMTLGLVDRVRNKGLSTELVLRCLTLREPPLERQLSEAGLGALKKAHKVAVEKAVESGLDVPERVRGENGLKHTHSLHRLRME